MIGKEIRDGVVHAIHKYAKKKKKSSLKITIKTLNYHISCI